MDGLNNLLKKEVDRKEFMAHIGATALAVIGVKGLLKAFTDPYEQSHTITNRTDISASIPKALE